MVSDLHCAGLRTCWLHSLQLTGALAPTTRILLEHKQCMNIANMVCFVTMAQGQTTNCVYFVMSGAVEVLGAPKRRRSTRTANGASHNGTGGDEEDEEELTRSGSLENSFTIDIDESLTLDYFEGAHPLMPQGAVNGRLHIDREKARDLRLRRRSWMMEVGGCACMTNAVLQWVAALACLMLY